MDSGQQAGQAGQAGPQTRKKRANHYHNDLSHTELKMLLNTTEITTRDYKNTTLL